MFAMRTRKESAIRIAMIAIVVFNAAVPTPARVQAKQEAASIENSPINETGREDWSIPIFDRPESRTKERSIIVNDYSLQPEVSSSNVEGNLQTTPTLTITATNVFNQGHAALDYYSSTITQNYGTDVSARVDFQCHNTYFWGGAAGSCKANMTVVNNSPYAVFGKLGE